MRLFLPFSLGAVLCFLGLAAQGLPDPQSLLAASRAAYQNLKSFEAVMTFAITFADLPEEVRQTWKMFFSFPFARVEYAEEEMMFLPRPVLEITDYQEGRIWILYTTEEWEEVHDEALKSSGLWLSFFPQLELEELGPLSVESGEISGQPAWVIRGKAFYSLFSMEIELWLEKETLFLRRWVGKSPGFTLSFTVESFKTGVELAPDLFLPPPAERVVRRFVVHPQGREIMRAVWDRLSSLKTFIVHKRITQDSHREEKILFYRHPYLRVETWTPKSPVFPGQLLDVAVFDFRTGFVYSHDVVDGTWEKEELFFIGASAEDTLRFALVEAFNIWGPVAQVVEIKEENLRGRKVWHLAARGEPRPDAPNREWWLDQETFAVLRYVEPMEICEPDGKCRWEKELVDIIGFEVDVEIADELFSVPPDVPLRRWEFPEEPVEEEPQGPRAELVGWEPFSFARLEEAKAQGKIVVLYFSADWCEPCHALEAGPLQDPRVQGLLDPLVRLKVDLTFPRGEAKKVADLYKVRAFPTLLFLDPAGQELGRVTGYTSTAALLQRITEILGGEK